MLIINHKIGQKTKIYHFVMLKKKMQPKYWIKKNKTAKKIEITLINKTDP